MKKLLTLLLISTLILGCTQNQRAKTWGGKETITLDKGQRLVNATWKGDQIWYLTEPMPEGYIPSNKSFREISKYGILQGEIHFIEVR